MEADEFCLRWNNHSRTIISVLDTLLAKESMCDVTLAADHQFLRVHRLVLCACSSYFEEMLSKQADKQAFIFLKDVRFGDLKALVDYMYKGEVNVAQDQLSTFLQTAEALDIKGLAYKDDGSDSLKSRPSQYTRQSGMKRSNEVLSNVQPQQQKNESTVRSKAPAPPAKKAHLAPSTSEAPAASELRSTQMSEFEDHFVAVDAKLESEGEGTDTNDKSGSHNGPDYTPQDGDDDWSASDTGLVTIVPNSDPGSLPLEVNLGSNTDSMECSTASGPPGTKNKTNGTPVNAGASRGGSYSMECPHCSKRYTHPNSYHRHVRNECIAVEPKFACDDCGLRFRRKAYLKDHHCQARPRAMLCYQV